jgi:hypothetical protein
MEEEYLVLKPRIFDIFIPRKSKLYELRDRATNVTERQLKSHFLALFDFKLSYPSVHRTGFP